MSISVVYETSQLAHIPVMLQEAVAALQVDKGQIIVDATFGRGGHTSEILRRLPTNGQVIALDRDQEAVDYGRTSAQFSFRNDPRLSLYHANFSQLDTLLQQLGLTGRIDGILFDLGVSSPQLDQAERGFSFNKQGPLGMRMDPSQQSLTAAEWLAKVPLARLDQVLAQYGEERYHRTIARAIVQARERAPLTETLQLAQIISAVYRHRERAGSMKTKRKKDPATKSFQAIRMVVNDELGELERGLEAAWRNLRVGGRLVTICFHSLEDRIVKQLVHRQAQPALLPDRVPLRAVELASSPSLAFVGAVRRAGALELRANVRARSAILRVIERIN